MQKVIYMNQLQEHFDCIDKTIIEYIGDGQIETYESFENYNLIAFDWCDLKEKKTQPAQILIYIDKDDLFYICENDISYNAAQNFFATDASNEHALYLFFRNLFKGLRDYITQVRESYQSQIGIEQNNLMKVFTIVTSIFLPLTLIAGWYGMNLQMPEFGWKYGYLFVVDLCVVVCAIWFIVFKKRNWFK